MAKTDNAMLGASGYARVENDFYPTPEECTIALIENLRSRGIEIADKVVWEPACGQGHISRVAFDAGASVLESDIAPQVIGGAVFDFTGEEDFTALFDGNVDFIITNPPYKRDVIDSFLAKCVMYARDYGITCAMLMRKEVDSAVTRAQFFRDCPYFDSKIELLWRPRWIVGSTGSPRHNYAWFVWSRAAGNRQSEIYYAAKPKKVKR